MDNGIVVFFSMASLCLSVFCDLFASLIALTICECMTDSRVEAHQVWLNVRQRKTVIGV